MPPTCCELVDCRQQTHLAPLHQRMAQPVQEVLKAQREHLRGPSTARALCIEVTTSSSSSESSSSRQLCVRRVGVAAVDAEQQGKVQAARRMIAWCKGWVAQLLGACLALPV